MDRGKKSSSVLRRPRYAVWLVILVALIGLGLFYNQRQKNSTPGNIAMDTASNNRITAPLVSSKLEGRWERTDGGYILELSKPLGNSDITAKYFNPKPINVGRSLWQQDGGKLKLMVELQDRNYPGSVYSLELDEPDDVLKGTYFQAVEKMTYNVEFRKAR